MCVDGVLALDVHGGHDDSRDAVDLVEREGERVPMEYVLRNELSEESGLRGCPLVIAKLQGLLDIAVSGVLVNLGQRPARAMLE